MHMLTGQNFENFSWILAAESDLELLLSVRSFRKGVEL
jgi:hypothetical protein